MSSDHVLDQLREAYIQKEVLDRYDRQYPDQPNVVNSNRNMRRPLRLPEFNRRTEQRPLQSSHAERRTGVESLGRKVHGKKALDEDLVPSQQFNALFAGLPIEDIYEEIVTECKSRMKDYLRSHLTLEGWLMLYHTLAKEASAEHPGQNPSRRDFIRELDRFVLSDKTGRVQKPVKEPVGKLVARGTWSLHVERESEAREVGSMTKITPLRLTVHVRAPERQEVRRRREIERQYELGEPLPSTLQLRPWKAEKARVPLYQPQTPGLKTPTTNKWMDTKEPIASVNSKVPSTYSKPSYLTPSMPKARIEPRRAHTLYADATNLARPSRISRPITKQSNNWLAAKNLTSQLSKAAATPVLSTKRTTNFTKNVVPAKASTRTIANKTNKGATRLGGRSTVDAKPQKHPVAVQFRTARPALRKP